MLSILEFHDEGFLRTRVGHAVFEGGELWSVRLSPVHLLTLCFVSRAVSTGS